MRWRWKVGGWKNSQFLFLLVELFTSFLSAHGTFLWNYQRNCHLLPFEVLYSWKKLEFQFNTTYTRRKMMIDSGMFVPENNIISGVKVSGNRMFMAVPRWKRGVPATLTWLPYPEPGPFPTYYPKRQAALRPYPNWEMNQMGNCGAMQYVHGIEIDQYQRMWVADVGRMNLFEPLPDNSCAPKLLLIDLFTNQVIHMHQFPETVVSRTTSFLKDIVVGCKTPEDCMVYISDAGDARIVVYSHRENRSWFAQHSSMVADPKAVQINVLGKTYAANMNVNGIALSPKDTNFSHLFYSPLSSYQLFSIETKELTKMEPSKASTGIQLSNSTVKDLGWKMSQSDGMTMDSKGLLYFGQVGKNSVSSWHTTANPYLSFDNQRLFLQSDSQLQWPDTFAFDGRGYLVITTNKLHRYYSNSLEFYQTNFRIVRFYVGRRSYMY